MTMSNGLLVLILLSSFVPGLAIFMLREESVRLRTVLNLFGATAKLVLVGSGPHQEYLQTQCHALNLDGDVLFAGHQPQVDPWLALMDVWMLPSLQECHSIGLLEAMRAGLPIVVTRVGGNPESISHEVEGILVSPASCTSRP